MPTIADLQAAQAFIATDPRAKAILSAAQAFAGGDGSKLIAAFKAHDWATVAETGITDALTVASAAGIPGAAIALKALPLLEFMAKHPAAVESAAMMKATGSDSPYDPGAHAGQNINAGA